MNHDPNKTRVVLDELIGRAHRLGASAAAAISAAEISVEDNLASLCREPQCENYGLSPGCPPHVSGPAGFRRLLKNYAHAVVFKIDVPSDILLSNQRHEIFQLLHEIAADIEKSAVKWGCPDAKAFVGGSCKQLFCRDHRDCRVLGGGDCRNPGLARPSMSGFGINVSKLMAAAGWQMDRITRETDPALVKTGTVSGLVLVS